MSSSSIAASSNNSGGNKLRITGLASGLDIDATVKKMLTGDQSKVDKAQQEQDVIKWKQEMYQDIIKDIKDLQSTFFDSASADKNILASSNYSAFDVTGGTSSVATMTAGVGAQTGIYKVSVAASTAPKITSVLSGKSSSTTLESLNIGLKSNISLALNVNGEPKTITLDNTSGGKTIGDLVNAINIQSGGSVVAAFNDTTDEFSLSGSVLGNSAKITVENATTDLLSANLGLTEGTIKYGTASLASKASVSGSSIVSNTSSVYHDVNWNGKKIGFDVDGGSLPPITVTTGATISDTVNNINAQINSNGILKGKVQAVVSSSGDSIQFQALSNSSIKIDGTTTSTELIDGTGELSGLKDRVINPSISTTLGDLGLTDATDSFEINFNGTTKKISVKNTDKLSDVINNISTATGGAVTASFSQLTGKFTIESSTTGSSQSISVRKGSDGTGSILNKLGIADNSSKTGTDATVTITPPGGVATTVIKSTNNFTIDGVSYNLTGEGDSTVTVANTNTDKVYDKIKTFVDKYNAIVDKIQTKLLEKTNSDYKPLTDTQKEAMTDSQITAWETKAKVGLLRNDENLQNMLSSLQSAFTTGVSGVGLTMGRYGSGSIGLDMSTDYSKPGHVDITDASKLKAAISTNGDQILKMFTNVSTYTDTDENKQKNIRYSENGIFARIKNIFEDNVGFTNTTLNTAVLTKYANKQDDFSMTGSSGTNTLPNQIYQKQLLITQLKQKLSDDQEAYYQKFSKLETAMNTLNSQQSYISQMMG